jgi:2-polyprenyl-6-methoxyphenol hydroxylase-like FAD-dependent oxidoreductase
MSANHVYDVLIIGVGPVGLATALGLYKQGIHNILVIDQAHSFRQSGQTVDLLPNGLKALKSICNEAYEKLKLASFTFTQPSAKQIWNRRNLQGEIIYSTPVDFDYWLDKYGEGRISISWYQIQTNLRNLLPAEIIKINHRCVNLHPENEFVSVDCISDKPVKNNPFAHWENSAITKNKRSNSDSQNNYEQIQHNFRAKLVIAADGINSTARQILYRNTNLQQWAKPQYSGYGAIGCFAVENVPNEIVQELETNYLQGDRLVTITPKVSREQTSKNSNPRIILIQKDTNSFGYLIHAPLDFELMLNSSAPEFITIAKQVLTSAGYSSAFVQLINLSNPEKLITRPYYIHPAEIQVENEYIWSWGRVVLVGDAAHGMPPFIAQGTNQGFEDALMIVKLVTNLVKNDHLEAEKIITNSFQEYEKYRRPFMSKIQSATMENHLWNQAQWDNYAQFTYSRNLSLEI